MYKFFTITTINIISVIFIIIILGYRKHIKIKLRQLAGSGRLPEIKALELRREYCLMGISAILIINLISKIMSAG
jgi:hypothetical protein